MTKYLITYTLDGVTAFLTFNGYYYTFDTKSEAERHMRDEQKANPEIKGWRVVRRFV